MTEDFTKPDVDHVKINYYDYKPLHKDVIFFDSLKANLFFWQSMGQLACLY